MAHEVRHRWRSLVPWFRVSPQARLWGKSFVCSGVEYASASRTPLPQTVESTPFRAFPFWFCRRDDVASKSWCGPLDGLRRGFPCHLGFWHRLGHRRERSRRSLDLDSASTKAGNRNSSQRAPRGTFHGGWSRTRGNSGELCSASDPLCRWTSDDGDSERSLHWSSFWSRSPRWTDGRIQRSFWIPDVGGAYRRGGHCLDHRLEPRWQLRRRNRNFCSRYRADCPTSNQSVPGPGL